MKSVILLKGFLRTLFSMDDGKAVVQFLPAYSQRVWG